MYHQKTERLYAVLQYCMQYRTNCLSQPTLKTIHSQTATYSLLQSVSEIEPVTVTPVCLKDGWNSETFMILLFSVFWVKFKGCTFTSQIEFFLVCPDVVNILEPIPVNYLESYSFVQSQQSLLYVCVIRYGAANMAAVKPMMQQPSGAKPNTSHNNNNEHTAAPSMQQEQSITQVRVKKKV